MPVEVGLVTAHFIICSQQAFCVGWTFHVTFSFKIGTKNLPEPFRGSFVQERTAHEPAFQNRVR